MSKPLINLALLNIFIGTVVGIYGNPVIAMINFGVAAIIIMGETHGR